MSLNASFLSLLFCLSHSTFHSTSFLEASLSLLVPLLVVNLNACHFRYGFILFMQVGEIKMPHDESQSSEPTRAFVYSATLKEAADFPAVARTV